jgi:MFS family permease
MLGRSGSVGLIVGCQVASMALWFSASAAVPALIESGRLDSQQASLLTGAVQLGFVAGTLVSAWLGLADRIDPRRLFAICAAFGAVCNALLLLTGFDQYSTVVLRFATGFAMAGVYPVGMKLASGWAEKNMGLMIGALVGALTLGSAFPHLIAAASDVDWRAIVVASSVSAVMAAIGINFITLGPRHAACPRFVPREAIAMLKRRSLLLANAGYLGHMWELYAMWAWLGAFFVWALRIAGDSGTPIIGNPSMLTFIVVASGAAGCVFAGAVADRIGRTAVTMAAMATSGMCAATIGLCAEVGPVALTVVAILWGFSVVADSAQFSASVVELSDPTMVGTALTVQTSLGFLLTVVAIHIMPIAVAALTWKYAFAVLAVGPFLGVLAMWRLRRLPEAEKLANGNR